MAQERHREERAEEVISRETDSSRTGEPIVSVEGLSKVYGDGEDAVEAVSDVSFDISPGTVVGILGPNGAGKTTTIKSALGLIFPSAGDIEVGGANVNTETRAAHETLSAMFEGARNTYWRLTVRENVEIFSVIGGNDYRERTDEIDDLLDQFDLREKEDEVVRDLSRGQKQKVSLACTLARDTEVLFLDEPTLGLDVESRRRLQRELKRLSEDDGRTVILSSHDMDVIQEVCDRVIVMNDGEIVADDTVDNLVGLFGVTNYEVTAAGRLDDDTVDQIATEFLVKNVERDADATTFEVETDGDEFYRLVETLERAGVEVDSFSEREVDFDDVFLHLTDRARQRGSAEEPAEAVVTADE